MVRGVLVSERLARELGITMTIEFGATQCLFP